MKQKIELQEVRSKSIKLDSGAWEDMFTVKILVNNRLEIIETDLKLNLIQELEKNTVRQCMIILAYIVNIVKLQKRGDFNYDKSCY